MNTVIDRLVSNEELRAQVLAEGAGPLEAMGLEPGEAVAVTDALRADLGTEPFTNLRRQARFEPLFAAASASATKIG
jgi:hypothetical protein